MCIQCKTVHAMLKAAMESGIGITELPEINSDGHISGYIAMKSEVHLYEFINATGNILSEAIKLIQGGRDAQHDVLSRLVSRVVDDILKSEATNAAKGSIN